MGWADAARQLLVMTNADNPRDAQQAVDLGAEGIGLCRTEHMFFAEDRIKDSGYASFACALVILDG